jgi:hypothetical protein
MRQLYNLVRGLDAERLVNMLDAATIRGEHGRTQWLTHEVIKRWPILRALRERRASALLKKEWSVVRVAQLPPSATDAQAQAQVDALTEAYGKIDNISSAIRFLSSAEFCGFAHCQKHRDPKTGEIVHLEPLDQWNWVRDGYRGPWYWNPTADPMGFKSLEGRPGSIIVPSEFVIREVENPIYEAALPLYLYYTLAIRDWVAYTEIFGIPKPALTMPEGTTGDKQRKEFLEAAEAFANGIAIAFPFGTQVTWQNENRAPTPFQPLLSDIDSAICVAVTGGKLTMLAQTVGLSANTAKIHQDAFNEIAEGEAQEISELFQKSIDKEILDRHFPGQEVLAYWKQSGKPEVDITSICSQVLTLFQAGWEVTPEQIEELTGFRVTKLAAPGQAQDQSGAQDMPGMPKSGRIAALDPNAPGKPPVSGGGPGLMPSGNGSNGGAHAA